MLSLGNAPATAMQGFQCTDSNIQIPTSGLGQGGKVSLNAIVSSLLSPLASRASLSVAVAAGWRRQQRFPWLSRKTGSYETMKHHRGAEKQGKQHREGHGRAGMYAFLHVRACDRHIGWHGRQRAYVHVSVGVSELD